MDAFVAALKQTLLDTSRTADPGQRAKDIAESLALLGMEVTGITMKQWAVHVDDPDMADSHDLQVTAPSWRVAILKGASQAIRNDPRGAGAGGLGATLEMRIAQSETLGIVEAVAAYATAEPILSLVSPVCLARSVRRVLGSPER